MQTRRDFMKTVSLLAGAAGVPGSIQKAMAIAPDPGTTWVDAEHIVILMQENRSFDHAFGTLQGVRGFNDPRAIRQANGQSIFLQTDYDGDTYQPWRLDIKDTKITWMGSIPHSRNSQVDAWNHGHHNNWIDSKKSSKVEYRDIPITMGHYTREDIPFHYALADAFTICDQNYCGVMSSTTPNRSIFWTGTIRDEQKTNSAVFMRNEEFRGRLKWKTFPERLTEAGVNWNIYQNEVNVADMDPDAREWLGNAGNVMEHFGVYNVHLTNASTKKLQADIDVAKGELAKLNEETATVDPVMKADHIVAIQQKQESINAMQAQLEHGGSLQDLSPKQQELHVRAFVTNVGDKDYHSLEDISFKDGNKDISMQVPKGDVFYQFRKDVKEKTLPTVSWVVPPGKFSDHPSHPWYGAWWISEVVDILTSDPEVWKKTILIYTYDENDGYFDHGQSYVAADPKNPTTGRSSKNVVGSELEYTYAPDEVAQDVKPAAARSGPIGLGFRVPMIVASPWSRGGYINSQLFDHSSSLQFVETFVKQKYGKDVTQTEISGFRRAICGDLTSCFHPANNDVAKLPFLERNPFLEGVERAKFREVPSNYKKLTAADIAAYDAGTHPAAARQEPGTRPSCALPYEMYCEGGLSSDGSRFGLAMRAGNSVHGDRSAGSPFNVYLRNTTQAAGVIERGKGNANMIVATYAVKAGDTLQEAFPISLFADNKYEIEVHGPNGFYRRFTGDKKASPLTVRCTYEHAGNMLSGDVAAHIKNPGTQPVTVTVSDNAYKTGSKTKEIPAGGEISIPVNSAKSHGWYDFTVASNGSAHEVRYAGRVETGRESISDPVMGGVIA